MSALPVCALYPCVWSDGYWCGTPALVIRLAEHPDTPPPQDDELPDDLPPVQRRVYGPDAAVTLNALLRQGSGSPRYAIVGSATLAATASRYTERHVVISAREPGRHAIDPVVRALQDA